MNDCDESTTEPYYTFSPITSECGINTCLRESLTILVQKEKIYKVQFSSKSNYSTTSTLNDYFSF